MVQAYGSKNQGNSRACKKGGVGDHNVVSGVIHPCQTWFMHHIPPIEQWDGIPIHVSSSLGHYITYADEVHCVGSFSFLPKTRVTAEHIRGAVGGHAVGCKVIHPCQTWSIPQITLIK